MQFVSLDSAYFTVRRQSTCWRLRLLTYLIN